MKTCSLAFGLLLVANVACAEQPSPMIGEWQGLYGSLRISSHQPIMGGSYSLQFNSSLNGESYSSDICNIDTKNFIISCPGNVYAILDVNTHTITAYSSDNIVATYYDSTRKSFKDNLYGRWHSAPNERGEQCTMTIKPCEDWHNMSYDITLNDDNNNIHHKHIDTNGKHYFIDLSRYITKPENVLTLNADPVSVNKICFGPGENWFCRHQDSVCFTKDQGTE